MFHLDPMADDA